MADTTALKNRIRAAIKANDNQEITGPVLQQALLDMVDELNGATETEASQRQSADNTLQQNITAEKTRAEEAESTLSQAIASEKTRAEGAESTLSQAIATEKTRAEGAESTLSQAIATEKTRAEGAEQTLQNNLTQATSQLQAAITNLRNAGYAFGGVAVTGTNPGIPTANCFYIVRGAGTYTHFKNADNESIVLENDGVYVLTYESVENNYWEWNLIIEIDSNLNINKNLVIGKAITFAINENQNGIPKFNKVTKLTNVRYIDNAFINNNGELVAIDSTDSYHFKALCKFPIYDYQTIALYAIRITGNSRLILYNKDGEILLNETRSGTIFINNSNKSYYYMSFGTNVISAEPVMFVTPFDISGEDKDNFASNKRVKIEVPDEFVSDRLYNGSSFDGHVDGYSSVINFYIGNYKNIYIDNVNMNTPYLHVWLSDGVTRETLDYDSNNNLFIDNSNGSYKYISYVRKDNNTKVFCNIIPLEKKIKELGIEIDNIKQDAFLKNRFVTCNILKNSDIIENKYITSLGELDDIQETETSKYNSVYFYPVKNLSAFLINGFGTGTNGFIKLYNDNFEEVGSYQQRITYVDNSNHSIAYASFCSNVKNYPLCLYATIECPISKSIDIDSELFVDVNLEWSEDRYINENNEFLYTISGESFKYYAIKDYYVKDAKKIYWTNIYTGSATRIVTSDINGNILGVYQNVEKCLDNSNGTIAYISLTNNFVTSPHPVFRLYYKPTVNEAIKYLLKEKVEIEDIKQNILLKNHFITCNILEDSDIIENTYIYRDGQLDDIQETETLKYNSVYHYPVKNLSAFLITGSNLNGTNGFIKLYNDNFEEVGSYQQRITYVDNSNHSIAYVSFCSNVKNYPLCLYATIECPISKSIDINTELFVDIDIDWLEDRYISEDNELLYTESSDTYKYYAIKDYYVKDAKEIYWSEFTVNGLSRIVTSDINGTILGVYQDSEKLLDNSNGTIAYISLVNQFIRSPHPVFKLRHKPTVNEAIKYLSKNRDSYPLKDKNIAVMGDSIMMIMAQSQSVFGGNVVTYRDSNDNIYDFSELTNIGGLLYVTSTLVDGQVVEGTTVQVDIHNSNQTGMDEASWFALKDALKANYIINTGKGGATIMGDEITTAYPAFLQSKFNTMPNHCLDLKRRVDAGEPSPDVIMIWAGTNGIAKFINNGNWVEPTNFDEIMALDYETQLLANTNAAMEYKKTIYGALRFCLEFLYRNFPNATVIFFSPIQSIVSPRTYDRERKIGSYIKKMAERYGALFVDACVEIGITDKIDTLDNHVWLYDGLHPNAAGKVLYCNYTANKLNNIAALKQ